MSVIDFAEMFEEIRQIFKTFLSPTSASGQGFCEPKLPKHKKEYNCAVKSFIQLYQTETLACGHLEQAKTFLLFKSFSIFGNKQNLTTELTQE